jgi:uncharacterized protein YutE (UPF0331/DUF86 family)
MVNVHKVEGMLTSLRESVIQLQEIAKLEKGELLQNGPVLGGAKYYLQIAIETCINIGNHIISAEGFRAPRDYRDVFSVLNENDILPDDFAITLRQMTGLRNRLVHLYWEVDDDLIYSYLQNNLGDFETFANFILEYIHPEGMSN